MNGRLAKKSEKKFQNFGRILKFVHDEEERGKYPEVENHRKSISYYGESETVFAQFGGKWKHF